MSSNIQFGKKISFFELISEKEYWIEIPIIQRDYAQGRKNAKDIRDHFLKTLRKHLQTDKQIDLDFVYGSTESKGAAATKFVPLDGQQRLTTLFLLHWYLALKDGQINEFTAVAKTSLSSKFTYETRVSSREFCNALLSNQITIPQDNTLSSVIRDSAWYFLSWDNDPTISSMLIMLDAIHELFFKTEGYYEKLISPENPIITFQFIELKNFGLSDTLYIKMNARGKVLTDFENFKAKLEQILEQHDIADGTNLKDAFAINIDTVCTDLFWKYRDQRTNTFDNKIMNLFRLLIMNQYALKKEPRPKNIQILFDKKIDLNFYKYEILKCFGAETVTNILVQLQLLADSEHKLAQYLESFPLLSEQILFEKAIDLNTNVNITEALQFHALYQYLIHNGSATGIDHWMRVIRNLTENTIYNEVTEYEASLKAIQKLLPDSNGILDFLVDEKNKIRSFWNVQLEEERIKAVLIKKDPKWAAAIYKMENHAYFNGQIGFLLKFSEILGNINISDMENWDPDDAYYNSFIAYSQKIDALFQHDGIKIFPNFLFQRALLSAGDYMLPKKKNFSFLVNGIERDISWKKLLRDDNKQRAHLKTLIDQISDFSKLESEMENIISQSLVEDWRKYFILYPEMIDHCGKNKFVRFDDDSEDILLLEKLQTNGNHREYFSFAFYIRLLRMKVRANYVASNSVDYFKYINQINGKKIHISFAYGTYRVKFGTTTTSFTKEQEIIDFLVENKLIAIEL